MPPDSTPPTELDLVAVGAHPDDVEIGFGGTLARLAQLGYRVGIIDLTDGEPTPHSPGPEARLAEARRAAEILGVAARETLDLPNRRLFDSFAARVALATQLRRYRPKVVVGMHGRTPLASPDHYQAMLITEAAVFYSRLTKWDEHFPGLEPHTVSAVWSYWLNLYSLTPPSTPGFFVADISDTLSIKLQAIRAYQTQFPPSKGGFFARVEAANRSWGQAAGFAAGELICTYRPVGLSDCMQLVLPPPARPAAPERL